LKYNLFRQFIPFCPYRSVHTI